MNDKTYWLLGPDGERYASETRGTLGGNAKHKIYGRLDCGSALAALRDHGDSYRKSRVFFADAETAIAAGYRPCGNCLRERFAAWQAAQGEAGTLLHESRWWSPSPIANPKENTPATNNGYETARDLGFSDGTHVWQLPLQGDEVLRLLVDPPSSSTAPIGSRDDLRDALSDAFDGLDVTLAHAEPTALMTLRPGALVASFTIPRTSPPAPDAFDFLGVSHREDSYTTLLARAFALDGAFRSALLRALGLSAEATDWACRLRVGVTASDKKGVPDLVVFSRAANQLAIIEAKIDADEGHRQTARYAGAEARTKLCVDLGLNVPADRQHGFFLTLDGTPPQSPWFKPLQWTVVAQAAEASRAPGTLGLLLRELSARVRQHATWPAPDPVLPVLRYLRRRPGLVTEAVVFRRLLDRYLMEDAGFGVNFSSTANPGCGYIPLCQWSKPSWERSQSGSDLGRSIHFELQWNTATDGLALYLHCETHPYRPKSDLLSRHGAAALAKHAAMQDDLFTVLDRHRATLTAAGWTLRRGYNMLASLKFPRFIRAATFHERLRRGIRMMAGVVNQWTPQAS